MISTLLGSRARKDYPYVLVIGFNKTGTTSIHKLFEDNGIPSIHWDNGNLARTCLINTLKGNRVLKGYDKKYNVFSDFMYRTGNFLFEGNSLFRQMNIDYPEAYFIYNTRNIDDWIKSRVNHTGIVNGLNLLQLQKRILSTTSNTQAIEYWKRARTQFEEELKEYFANNNRFIEIDISDPCFPEIISSHTKIPLNVNLWKNHSASIIERNNIVI